MCWAVDAVLWIQKKKPSNNDINRNIDDSNDYWQLLNAYMLLDKLITLFALTILNLFLLICLDSL